MEDKTKETQDANIEEDKTSKNEELDEASIDSIDDIEKLRKDLKTMAIQKEKYRSQLNSLKKEEDTKEEKKEVISNVSENERLDILDFSIQHKDLERDAIVKINKYAKSLGISMEQALEDDFIKAGIEANRQKRASEEASFDSNRSPRSSGGKKLVYKQNMTDEEFKKLAGY